MGRDEWGNNITAGPDDVGLLTAMFLREPVVMTLSSAGSMIQASVRLTRAGTAPILFAVSGTSFSTVPAAVTVTSAPLSGLHSTIGNCTPPVITAGDQAQCLLTCVDTYRNPVTCQEWIAHIHMNETMTPILGHLTFTTEPSTTTKIWLTFNPYSVCTCLSCILYVEL